MIALRNDLPLIQLENGHAVAFEREWLLESLTRAAELAGYSEWWLAEHVTESVAHYLKDQSETCVIPVEQLGRAVQAAVEVIGYADIARHFKAGRPRMRVSLLDMARAAGHGYELAFFESLSRRIWELVRDLGYDFCLVDLEMCVKLLRGRKAWSRDCDALRSDIVFFTRQQTALAAAGNDASCAMA